jgi:alpha/beta superfamily hydrolase
MRRVESTDAIVDGRAGRLEAVVETIAGAYSDAVAVICHPHPLYHGTMNNKVVHTIARAVNRLNRPAVRFNFRGVGASQGEYAEGEGETEDVLAVVEWARLRWPSAELWLAGFSFGAFVALKSANRTDPACLVTVAPPIHRFAVSDIPRPSCPWLIIQGERDELVNSSEVAAWASGLRPAPRLELMAETDHFFHGRLTRLRDAVEGFLSSRAPACEDT